MTTSDSKQVAFDSRYVEELLLDESNIASRDYAVGLELLRSYSKIPEGEIASHVAQIVSLLFFPPVPTTLRGFSLSQRSLHPH